MPKWLAKELGPDAVARTDGELRAEAARYLTTARTPSGKVLDSVARFHLGNGARLEAIHAGPISPNGLRQSHGVMVNYVYDLAEIEANHFATGRTGHGAGVEGGAWRWSGASRRRPKKPGAKKAGEA